MIEDVRALRNNDFAVFSLSSWVVTGELAALPFDETRPKPSGRSARAHHRFALRKPRDVLFRGSPPPVHDPFNEACVVLVATASQYRCILQLVRQYLFKILHFRPG